MWKQKIGISAGGLHGLEASDFTELLARTGFDAISPGYRAKEELDTLIDEARKRGLAIQSIHAPYTKSAHMWRDDPECAKIAVDELIAVLESCARHEVPIMVCHTWIGFDYPDVPGETGFKNYKTVIDRARELGVKVALENTEGEEFLFALLDRFGDEECVGFCWDSGHEMCYNHSEDLLGKYGDKLLLTHLNDNLGISRFDGKTFWTDDLHLLPFDGIADWRYNTERLKKCPRLDILNLELSIGSKPHRHDNDVYAAMKLEVYYAEAYKRACRIANMYLN